MMLKDAAASGDRLKALEALRDHLADALTSAEDVRATAALAGQLRMVLAEIAELSKGSGAATGLDELLSRRKDRAKPIRGGKSREA